MDEAQQTAMKSDALLVCFPQPVRTDAQALAGNLDVSLVLGPMASQHDCETGHAFAADDADLNARLRGAVCDHRGEARFDEIDLLNALFSSLQRLSHGEINCFEMRFEQRKI